MLVFFEDKKEKDFFLQPLYFLEKNFFFEFFVADKNGESEPRPFFAQI